MNKLAYAFTILKEGKPSFVTSSVLHAADRYVYMLWKLLSIYLRERTSIYVFNLPRCLKPPCSAGACLAEPLSCHHMAGPATSRRVATEAWPTGNIVTHAILYQHSCGLCMSISFCKLFTSSMSISRPINRFWSITEIVTAMERPFQPPLSNQPSTK